MKKTHISMGIVLLLTAALLCGCASASAAPAAETAAETDAKAVTLSAVSAQQAPTPVFTAESSDAFAERISGDVPAGAGSVISFTERCNYSDEYTDSYGNTCTYSYCMPVVQGGTSYAEAVNNDLMFLYSYYVEGSLENMSYGNTLEYPKVSWVSACYQGYTSLLVKIYSAYDCDEYYVWNFAPNGSGLTSNSDLFSLVGMSSSSFTSRVAEILEAQLSINDTDDASDSVKQQISDARARTLGSNNVHDYLSVFITDEGTLCFIGRIYSIAGADYYDHLFIVPPQNGFSTEELTRFALTDYAADTAYEPQYAAAELQADGTVAVQLFDQVVDHNSTADWYVLDPMTGTGTNSMGQAVDITVQ